ncbi:class I adenylate-forming enzyme family protein [Actinophytocola sediminis]
MFDEHAAKVADRVAVTLDGTEATYGWLDAAAERHAAALRAVGTRPGDRVVVYAELSLDVVAAVIGILRAGCCVVTTHPTFPRQKLIHQIDESDAAVLVTDGAEDAAGLLADTDLDAVIRVGGPAHHRHRPVGRTRRDAGIEVRGDLAALFYTTGSSAAPKAVTITHHNMIAAVEAVTGYHGITAEDVILTFVPIGSDFGFYNIMMPLAVGGRVVLGKGVPEHPEQLVRLIAEQHVTAVHGFPSVLALLRLAEGLDERAVPSLRYLSSTGQRLPVDHIRALRRALPGVALYSMYGMSECKRICALAPEEIDRRPTSVGTPIPGVRAYLVGDDGELVEEPGAVGELAVAGDLVMQGYWRRPEPTARVLRAGLFGEDRVLFTGDLFRRDPDGYLYWVARRDDTFKRGMFNVNPNEVEARLREHPDVLDAVVVAAPDDREGEVPVACVVARAGSALDAGALVAHCADRLDWNMVPASVAFLDALPRTPSGKTDRRALRRDLRRQG